MSLAFTKTPRQVFLCCGPIDIDFFFQICASLKQLQQNSSENIICSSNLLHIFANIFEKCMYRCKKYEPRSLVGIGALRIKTYFTGDKHNPGQACTDEKACLSLEHLQTLSMKIVKS